MEKIQKLYALYHNMDIGDLSNNQKNEIKNSLASMVPEDLATIDEHKMYIEVLQKLRQSNMYDMQLLGKKFVATLESLLAVGEDGVYSNSQRFIYELIQNVDDCEYENLNDCNLDIKFNYHTTPGKIVLTYNEKGFRPENVFAITGIAEASKNISADKVEIGEKGIGFKSVFGIADKVHIESGMFSFELTKKNFIVPIPRYDNFQPVKGTRLTLEMSAAVCKTIYRNLADQYCQGDAALNKNPILFLNKLTHLKMFFDGFRYIEFNVERMKPEKKEEILFEKDVKVSINMHDYIDGREKKYSTEISCYRYTLPIIYGVEECISRYGADVVFKERKHNIIAVFPKITDELKKKEYKGILYSFLPTQVKTTVPVILHVPFKLDGSREFVDPQKKNSWFQYTLEILSDFLKNIYIDLSHILHEKIVYYIPKKHSYFFERDNEKINCLCIPELQGDTIVEEKIFYTVNGTFERSSDIVSFGKDEVVENPIEVHRMLSETHKLFIPPEPMDMKVFNCQTITGVISLLFNCAMRNSERTDEILSWLEKTSIDYSESKLIENNIPYQLTQSQIVDIGRHRKWALEFLHYAQNSIINKKIPKIELIGECSNSSEEIRNTIIDLVENADLDSIFETYLKKVGYKLNIVSGAKGDFVMPMKNGIVLSAESVLSSFAQLSRAFDPRKTFSATLNIRQASEQLNTADESLSNIDYLKLLRAVRKTLKDAFGNRMYNSYICIINEAGAEKERFLNELLQNADDCEYAKSVVPQFSLKAEGNILIASYNENGFTKDNVRAITAIGESTKKLLLAGNESTIGEKGVGFKSVFGVAKSVEIHSNGFDFKLTDKMPTVPEKCEIMENVTGTVMKFEMKEELQKLFNVDRILQLCICLRNLREISIFGHTVAINENDTNRIVTVDGKKYLFEKIEYGFEIKEQSAIESRKMNGRYIGEKQKIVCYIPERIKDQQFLLYAGLPTTIKSNVPLIIDAPLELTTSREMILHNKWNEVIRTNIYQAILNVMEKKRNTGLDVLKYVDFRSQNNTNYWGNFEGDLFLNKFNWIDTLKNRKFLPILGQKNQYTSVTECHCIVIPEFISKLQEYRNVSDLFNGTVINVSGKSQYVPLLEAIGCLKAGGTDIYNCLRRLIPEEMSNTDFRNGLFAYLSNKQGNVSFEGIGSDITNLQFIPIRNNGKTEYINYCQGIYTHPTEQSKEDFYILDTSILSMELCDAILGKYGRVNELSQDVFDAKYAKNLEHYIENNAKDHSDKEIAAYLLYEYQNNRFAFGKCLNNLKGLLPKIPLLMADGKYKKGNKFLNKAEQFFAGPLILALTVDEKYKNLAMYLECSDILDIHYSDIDIELDDIIDDDIEDLQCDFKNFSEIIRNLIDEGLISDEQIEKYNLQFALGGSTRNEDDPYEEFPEMPVKNINRLKSNIKEQWKRKNPYVEKHYIQWKPKYHVDKENYALNMYQSYYNKNKCFCQMCGELHAVQHIERNNIERLPAYAWNQMTLNLCLNCSKDYMFLRNNSIIWKQFLQNLMQIHIGTDGIYDVPIGSEVITFTATHLAEVQEILKIQGWGDNAPKRKPELGNRDDDGEMEEDITEQNIEQGIMRPYEEEEHCTTEIPLKKYLELMKLEVVDARRTNGQLWVIGEASSIKEKINAVSALYDIHDGCYAQGGKIVDFQTGWFTKSKK